MVMRKIAMFMKKKIRVESAKSAIIAKINWKLDRAYDLAIRVLRVNRFLPDAPRKIVFLDWYQWVKVDLRSYLRLRHVVIRPTREDIFQCSLYKNSRLDINLSNYESAIYEDIFLWEVCKSSILDYLIKPTIEKDSDLEVVRHYYEKAIHLIQAFQKYFALIKPDSVVVVQGFQYDMRVAVETARKFNCKTIAIENSFIRDYFFLDSASGGICNRHFLARNAWDILKARVLSQQERIQVREFITSYQTTIPQSERSSPEALRQKATKGTDKKIALLFGQVATDAAIIMDSHIYRDIVDFIEDAAQIMEAYKDEYQLVIRLHPKEAYGDNHHAVLFENPTLKRLQNRGIDRLEHVTIFHSDQVNTYDLMDISDFGIVINSQTGLEFLARYKPLVVLGDAFYANKGFTTEVTFKEAFPAAVKKAMDTPFLSKHQKAEIDKFLYFMIFEYLFPKDLSNCAKRIENVFS
jgi:capsule polysaccharide modification protein KpsS